MNIPWTMLTVLGLLWTTGCQRASEPPEASGAPEGQARTVLRVTPERQKTWGIEVSTATRSTVTGTIVIPGVLTFDPGRTAQIASLLEGRVTTIDAQVGDVVRAGQTLVTLRAPALAQAKTTFLQAASRLDLARQEYDRAGILLKQEAIDRREHLRRQTDFTSALNEFDVAESNLHSYGMDQTAVDRLRREARRPADPSGATDDHLSEPTLSLTTPVHGRVVAVDVVNGQFIEPRQALVTVSDLSTLWAMLDAREADLPHVARGRTVRITTSIYPDRAWLGTVDYVGDIVDPKTRTVSTRVVVRNEARLLKPNMYIQGELLDARAVRDALSVPQEAIQTIGGESVVFVREGVDVFAARPVELGEKVGERRVVLAGLDESAVVVVAGAFTLKAELLKSTLAGE